MELRVSPLGSKGKSMCMYEIRSDPIAFHPIVSTLYTKLYREIHPLKFFSFPRLPPSVCSTVFFLHFPQGIPLN